jgi:hypothetical protein
MVRIFPGILYLLITIFSMLPVGPSLAGTRLVPGDYPSIADGVAASVAGDTVLVSCGTYFEHGIALPEGITLMGESTDPSCVVIDAQNLGRILDCVDLVSQTRIENITFTNGYTVEGWFTALGGGVRALTSNLAIANCVFRGNTSRIGAGFGASESTIAMVDCLFEANTAAHEIWAAGGGVWARDCVGSIDSCVVIDNTAFSDETSSPGDGGGFFFNNCNLAVTNSRFERNATGAGAGGFYSVTTDSSIFTGCDFIANTAGNGGAVYFEYGAAAQLVDCQFLNNSAVSGGAIVSFNDSFPTITDCFFEGNQATVYSGGAVEAWDSEVVISGSVFRGNTGQSGGGGAHFGSSTVDISGCIFSANSTGGVGGAIRCHYATIRVTSSTLVGNSASQGGGIYCGTSSFATVDRTIIAFSPVGESLAGLPTEFAQVSCSNFFGNEGGDWTGSLNGQLALEGNFSADPLFCTANPDEYQLDALSPCAPGNGGDCGLVGAVGVGCSVSAALETLVPIPAISEAVNYPNPFNPATTIRFELGEPGPTRVVVFDLRGRAVKSLVDGPLPAQIHEVVWRGRNDEGREVAAGVYFYRISRGDFQVTGRMALIK